MTLTDAISDAEYRTGEIRIHGRDGKIRDSDTVAPGDDPHPPRDRK